MLVRTIGKIPVAITLLLSVVHLVTFGPPDSIPKEKTGGAMGLLGTVSAAGTALGPTLGGGLIAAFNWSAIYLLNVPLAVAALLLAYHCLLSRTCAHVRSVLFLSRIVLQTAFVSDRRHFPACGWQRAKRSAAHRCTASHG